MFTRALAFGAALAFAGLGGVLLFFGGLIVVMILLSELTLITLGAPLMPPGRELAAGLGFLFAGGGCALAARWLRS